MRHLRLLPLCFLLLLTACAPIRKSVVVDRPAELAPPEPPAGESSDGESSDGETSDALDPATAPLDAELPVDPKIRVGTFDNGLKYYLRVNRRPEQRADLRLLVNAGSLLEDDDQQGLAHFVEHMAFNGTDHFAKQELVEYLESIGMRFGPDLNAYTGFDETVYMLRIPTDDDEIVAQAFQIFEDWAHGIAFEEAEIDKERGVVIEEWRLGRGAGARLRDEQFPVMFRGSRYAERLPIGKKEILETAPYDAVRRFYRDWYRPDLMAVVAVGDFDIDRFEALIRQHFAAIPNPESTRQRVEYEVPDHRETLFSAFTDPELSSTGVAVHYKLPAEPEGSYGDYRRSLVRTLYHGMLNARLSEIAQQADPPFLYAGSGGGSFIRSKSVITQQAGVREGEVERGLEALLREVERVDRHGFTASELERIKTNVLRSYEQGYRERDKLRSESLAAEYGRNFFVGEPIPGIEVELELARRFLPTISLEEVNNLASRWISEENRVILLSGPAKSDVPLPAEEAVLAVFDAVEERDIEPFVDRVRDAPLLAAIPTPAEITSETTIAELGVTEWRLANGIRVILKPTDFQNDQVIFTAWSPGGHSLVDDEHHTSAAFATAILGESGLGAFSRIELGKAMAGKVASAGTYIGELEEGAGGGASPQDLETMFQLLYLRFTEPRFEQEAFESLMAKLRIAIENRLSRPGTVYQDKLGEVLSRGHPRRRPLSEELLAEIDPQRALAIYRERFADAGDFTFVFVGNFEPAALESLVRTYLGGLPAAGREETWRDIGVRRPEEVVRFEVERGLEPKSQVSLSFSGEAAVSRAARHEISALARVLEIRLRELLREDLGATYGVSVGGGLSEKPVERYTFSVGFGCDPGRVDALVETVFAELEKVKAEGLSEEDLAKVQEAQRRKRELDLKENGFWLRVLESYYSRDLDPRLILAFDELQAGVSVESLQEAARRYLNMERYVLGVLKPEAGAEGEAGR